MHPNLAIERLKTYSWKQVKVYLHIFLTYSLFIAKWKQVNNDNKWSFQRFSFSIIELPSQRMNTFYTIGPVVDLGFAPPECIQIFCNTIWTNWWSNIKYLFFKLVYLKCITECGHCLVIQYNCQKMQHSLENKNGSRFHDRVKQDRI